ncbi:MAG TPA: hypothetical protein VFE24_13560 [Pirellulales bacterium]|jgi:hypothetical protein|nr:hypothetical protein [Pirellulales bacterium]
MNTRLQFWSFVVALALLAFTPSTRLNAADGDSADSKTLYSLVYKFHPGQILRHDVTHLATSETTVAGVTQRAQTVTKSIKRWEIGETTPEGLATIVHSVESLKMQTKLLGRAEVGWDSTSGEKPPAGYETAAKAIGVPLVEVSIDRTGKILKREELQLQKSADSKSNQMVVPLPLEPVAIGGQWNLPHDIDVAVEGGLSKRIKTRQHFELKSVRNGIAEIAVDSQVLTPVDAPQIRVQLMQHISKGTIHFDIEAGLVISQELNWDERVLGFAGPDSTMKYVAQFKEFLIKGPKGDTASREPGRLQLPKNEKPKRAAQAPVVASDDGTGDLGTNDLGPSAPKPPAIRTAKKPRPVVDE